MKITIQSPGITVKRKISKAIEDGLSSLEKLYSPTILEAQVCLKEVNDSKGQTNSCEIRLVIAGNDLFASKQAETFDAAVHETIDALKHQVSRLRTNLEKQRMS
jgi:ribosomal subunit interface protein